MAVEELLPAPGAPIEPEGLLASRARDVVQVLRQFTPPYIRLIECRRCAEPDGADVVVLDVEVERPQRPVHDIRSEERVAILFRDDDRTMPEVLALRADFPMVPHLNLRLVELPRSLCLYELPWRDLKPRWTPRAYIERIREWLALTAAGLLHAADQPLEPFLMGWADPLVLPEGLLGPQQADLPEVLSLELRERHGHRTLVALRSSDGMPPGAPPFVATVVHCQPQVHGVIRWQPASLRELHGLLVEAGDDLLSLLRERLRRWQERRDPLDRPLILITVLPKMRIAGGIPESSDTYAFLFCHPDGGPMTILQVGEEIGLWQALYGRAGLLLTLDRSRDGAGVALQLLNPLAAFSRSLAARLNRLPAPTAINIAAVGTGALGSQVVMNQVRAGWGQWTLIDEDTLLPHNLARHTLPGHFVGWPKAHALAALANSTVDGEPVARGIVADVLDPGGEAEQIAAVLLHAELILDMSASVAVARHLARDVMAMGRRISLFLNPTGTDLVLLAEDAERLMPLDVLEMVYYRHLIDDPACADHLQHREGRLRYGRTCRDLSVDLPQDQVALHAAIASRALKATVACTEARIAIWQANPDNLSVRCIEIVPTPMVEQRIGAWRLLADERVLVEVARLRRERLPNETGGVLIGAFDLERKIIYVVSALPSPADSLEWSTAYIRGSRDLAQRVNEIGMLTDAMLQYAGEWHSHPDGVAPIPSRDDRAAFAWLAEQRALDGLPPLMLTVGAGERYGWYLASMPPEHSEVGP